MRVESTYICEICGTRYEDKKKAEQCESQRRIKLPFGVGDIVFLSAGFTWFDGDPNWVSNIGVKPKRNHGNCFGECCTLQFFYAVSAIDDGPDTYRAWGHRAKIYVVTLAMTGEKGHRGGFTFMRTHITPRLVQKRQVPEAVKLPPKMIGGKIDYLL